MAALNGPEAVYYRFIDTRGYDADGDPEAVALFAFALVERDKFEWISHRRREDDGAGPSDDEVEKWYKDKPERYFQEKERIAIEWYMSFARVLLNEEFERARLSAIQQFFQNKLGFWFQLGVTLACNIIVIFFLGR